MQCKNLDTGIMNHLEKSIPCERSNVRMLGMPLSVSHLYVYFFSSLLQFKFFKTLVLILII